MPEGIVIHLPLNTHLPINTKRLLLRDFEPGDWAAVHKYAADPDVVRFVEWGPNSEDQTREFVERVIAMAKVTPRVDYELAVVSLPQNELIGAASIHISNPSNREGWIGYCLNKAAWGKGFATEAARSLIDFGMSELRLHRVFATVDPANSGSQAVLTKVGMKYEGHFREHKLVRGKWRDTLIYSILESDKVD